MARIITNFGWLPRTMKPPIITLSSVWTKLRVLMLPRIESALELRSYTSTRPTPVVLFSTANDRSVVTWLEDLQ